MLIAMMHYCYPTWDRGEGVLLITGQVVCLICRSRHNQSPSTKHKARLHLWQLQASFTPLFHHGWLLRNRMIFCLAIRGKRLPLHRKTPRNPPNPGIASAGCITWATRSIKTRIPTHRSSSTAIVLPIASLSLRAQHQLVVPQHESVFRFGEGLRFLKHGPVLV